MKQKTGLNFLLQQLYNFAAAVLYLYQTSLEHTENGPRPARGHSPVLGLNLVAPLWGKITLAQ